MATESKISLTQEQIDFIEEEKKSLLRAIERYKANGKYDSFVQSLLEGCLRNIEKYPEKFCTKEDMEGSIYKENPFLKLKKAGFHDH